MHIWYDVVCDEHKELTTIMVNNPERSMTFLKTISSNINDWLEKHYGCELRFIHRDDQLDKCYNDKYTRISFKT